jgi:homoserine kinase
MVPHADAVFNLSRAALFLGSLICRDYQYLKTAMQDRLHQIYRKKLVPGFDSVIKNGYQAGALGLALSGAGPSMFALVPKNKAQAVGQAMEEGFKTAGHGSQSYILDFDSNGAKVRTS